MGCPLAPALAKGRRLAPTMRRRLARAMLLLPARALARRPPPLSAGASCAAPSPDDEVVDVDDVPVVDVPDEVVDVVAEVDVEVVDVVVEVDVVVVGSTNATPPSQPAAR